MGAALLCLVQAAPGPSPSPGASPTQPPPERPRRLRLDIEKHVEDVMQDHGGPPRFQESVEVLGRTPDAALAEQLQEFDLECGPSSGAPTAVESREFRPHPAPFIDLSGLARLLSGAMAHPGPARYFLYRIHHADGPDYLLREGALTVAPGQQPATAFELVGSFSDLASAVRGFRRMEQGFTDPERADAGEPPPPWTSAPCRLRPRR